MRQIPFTLQVDGQPVYGFLNDVHKHEGDLPRLFHVVEKTPAGNYYRGQLMLNPFKGWWLPDSKFEGYAEQLGELVQVWWG